MPDLSALHLSALKLPAHLPTLTNVQWGALAAIVLVSWLTGFLSRRSGRKWRKRFEQERSFYAAYRDETDALHQSMRRQIADLQVQLRDAPVATAAPVEAVVPVIETPVEAEPVHAEPVHLESAHDESHHDEPAHDAVAEAEHSAEPHPPAEAAAEEAAMPSWAVEHSHAPVETEAPTVEEAAHSADHASEDHAAPVEMAAADAGIVEHAAPVEHHDDSHNDSDGHTAAPHESAAAVEHPAAEHHSGHGDHDGHDTAPIELDHVVESADHTPVADDLTRLRGLDGDLHGKLSALGVTRFEDIEKLSAEDEIALEERLGIPAGHIAREQWRSQAALLRAGNEAEFNERYGLVDA